MFLLPLHPPPTSDDDVSFSDFSISFCSHLDVRLKVCLLGAHLLQYDEAIAQRVLIRNHMLTGFLIFFGMVVIVLIILKVI